MSTSGGEKKIFDNLSCLVDDIYRHSRARVAQSDRAPAF